jgi:RNA polymerase sigma factor (sigma-70 family)
VKDPLHALIDKATSGDCDALESLIRAIQDQVFALSLRMLGSREDAQDATQDILVKIVTRLSQFKKESAFSTWVFRVASNHLIDVKRTPLESLTFSSFGEDLSEQIEPADIEQRSPEFELLVSEVRIGCTLALLQCLERSYRLAYILGEILELDHTLAAMVAEIEPATFRKRLERAREQLESFTRKFCGVLDAKNSCRCERRVSVAKRMKRIPNGLGDLDSKQRSSPEVIKYVQGLIAARRTAAQYRALDPVSPIDFARKIRDLIAQTESSAVDRHLNERGSR